MTFVTQVTRRKKAALAGVAFLFFCLAGAWWLRHQPPTTAQLVKTDFTRLAGWKNQAPAKALKAFQKSCAKGPVPGGQTYAGSRADWRHVCQKAQSVTAENARVFFAKNFVPFRVEPKAGGKGLFTGYYTPVIEVRKKQTGGFSAPVYGLPADLVMVDLGAFRKDLKGRRIAGKVIDGHLVPYADRAEIDRAGVKNAPVLAWADPVDLFFLQIQGSGLARFGDGTMVKLQYAGQNGQPYTAIGRVLIQMGAIAKEKMSMQAIRSWLKTHPQKAETVMEQNASYVFFTSSPLGAVGGAPMGAAGVPLTEMGSIAVDGAIHPLGLPFYLVSHDGQKQPLNRLFIAQDHGGAIRGAVRADIYFGIGRKAEARAGAMAAAGQLYVLLPRKSAAAMPERVPLSKGE